MATAAKPRPSTQHHHLRASPETVHWGFLDSKLPPVLSINSGDTVTIDCVSGNSAQRWPGIPPDAVSYEVQPPDLAQLIAAWQTHKQVAGL